MADFNELFEPGTADERRDPDYGENAAEQLGLSLKQYPFDLLLSLRAEIDAALPPMKLSSINLEQELMIQYQTAKALQTQTLAQPMTEANKKAQVVNTTASTLQALIKMQADFHTAERFKKIEVLLIECLRAMPEEMTTKFFERYERELGAMR
jgi:hypothetical protein